MKKSLTEDLAEIIQRVCKQPEIYALSAKFIVISQEREKQNNKKNSCSQLPSFHGIAKTSRLVSEI